MSDTTDGELESASFGATPELGRLDRVPLRTIWNHEAYGFTPWLANNLDRLGEALGIALELEARERSVGSFFIDILARTDDDRKVIIENQLETSDHSHLGQCLTYAAGVDAAVVVWVVPQLLPEHRAALDWLNEHTDQAIQFFGVELSAVRIGQSLPAPMFAVETRPNDWQKEVRDATSRPSSWRGWPAAYAALAAVPAGRWIALQDVAKIAGTSPGWVGRHLYGKWDLPGLHRMLYEDGAPWRWFEWSDPEDQRTQREALEAEGVPFDESGRAQQQARFIRPEVNSETSG